MAPIAAILLASFFLWSSIPDERLLALAERGQLSNPATLEKEVRRMLADPRATDALVNDFAAQWLNLRRVEEVVVDPDKYPNYDESLLQAFKQETEMFVGSNFREDRRSPICWTRITLSSMKDSRGTTGFRMSRAAASGA